MIADLVVAHGLRGCDAQAVNDGVHAWNGRGAFERQLLCSDIGDLTLDREIAVLPAERQRVMRCIDPRLA